MKLYAFPLHIRVECVAYTSGYVNVISKSGSRQHTILLTEVISAAGLWITIRVTALPSQGALFIWKFSERVSIKFCIMGLHQKLTTAVNSGSWRFAIKLRCTNFQNTGGRHLKIPGIKIQISLSQRTAAWNLCSPALTYTEIEPYWLPRWLGYARKVQQFWHIRSRPMRIIT
jgi:hypothetical protein